MLFSCLCYSHPPPTLQMFTKMLQESRQADRDELERQRKLDR